MESWRLLAAAGMLKLQEELAALVESFPEYDPPPPDLEGITIREVEGGPNDGFYEVIGLCRTCNQCVSHLVHPDASGDELHRAFHCECRSAEGYRLPAFTRPDTLDAGGPCFLSYLLDAEPFDFTRNGGLG